MNGEGEISPLFFLIGNTGFVSEANMKRNSKIPAAVLAVMMTATGYGQVASHTPTPGLKPHVSSFAQPTGRPVVKVNGVTLTDRDLIREEYTIFPYARQHNGSVPTEMEPQIRQGAMQMIIFEELVYQDAQRRKLTVPAAKLDKAEKDFRQQFSTEEEFNQLLQAEFQGSREQLREKIRRSLLIEELLKAASRRLLRRKPGRTTRRTLERTSIRSRSRSRRFRFCRQKSRRRTR